MSPMAGAHGGAFSPMTLFPTTTPPKLLKPLLNSSVSTPLPPKKLTKRKNHLRPKILKTLTKPILPQEPSVSPLTPVIAPSDKDVVLERPLDRVDIFVPAVDEVEEIQISETEGFPGVYSGDFGKFSSDAIKIGLGLVGVLVLQSIWTVWVLGNADSDEKTKNLNGLNNGNNGMSEGNILVNKNVVCLDKPELVDRINEIRAMARDARKIEEKEKKNGEEENGIADENMNSKGTIGIEKEIGERLVKLQKKLNSKRGKLSSSYVNFMDEYKDDANDEDEKEVDEMLMFMKKLKFRSPLMSFRDDVKGFSGIQDRNVGKRKKSGFAEANVDSRETISKNADSKKNEIEVLDTNSKEKIQKEMGVEDSDTRFGTLEETNQVRSSTGFAKSGNQEMQKMPNITKHKQEAITPSNKNAVNGNNGRSEQRIVEKRPLDYKAEGSQSDIKSDMWWANLPYVLGIFMRRDSDLEGQGGLFTLRSSSEAVNQSLTSYTVAFEDRGDANNFCYLLETYFADLGDFSAEIVPLSVKELLDAAKSGTKKVIVARKGRLKLYAGQPFADVEMALLSLEEDPSGSTANRM